MSIRTGSLQDLEGRVGRGDWKIGWAAFRQITTPISKLAVTMTGDVRAYCRDVVDAICINMAIDAQDGNDADLGPYVDARSIQTLCDIAAPADDLAVIGLSLLLHGSSASSWDLFNDILNTVRDRHTSYRFATCIEVPPDEVVMSASQVLDSPQCRSTLASVIKAKSISQLAARPATMFVYLLLPAVRGWSTPFGVVINVTAVWKTRFLHLTNGFALACLAGHEEAHFQMRQLMKDENVSSPDVLHRGDVAPLEASQLLSSSAPGPVFTIDLSATRNAAMEVGLHFELAFFGQKFEYNSTPKSTELVELLEMKWATRPTTLPLLTPAEVARFKSIQRSWNKAFAFDVEFYDSFEI
ncbi:Uncharacterized protein PBTT_09602 [Plasmodiophora brassicae]|uniref:Uncharacterized protein n=1 Tax=Plasmodiophora brassicae TaxID=37360 RepID=A0A0G4J0R4_PLABS|nr:hypothetical protein PBRA_008447 [Plasmodiophora brassicae]SPR01591.1 unnamed protein product [Plasmodiophora brassicae]